MATAVIAGAGIAGLAAALALEGTGHRVLLLDRAAEPPRGDIGPAADGWVRPTVPQGVHSHTLTSLGVRVLRERAPHVLEAALAAGAELLDLTEALPSGAAGAAPEPGDEELVALGCRRTALELVLYRAVRELPGVTVRHRTTVSAVELDPAWRAEHARDAGAVRAVRAVRTADGERIPAGIVVDATGRQAAARGWLRAAGVPVAEDRVSPSGLSGFTRFYRLTGDGRPGPLNRGNAAGDIWDHYAGVLHPGDNGTFSIALATLPGDRALHGLHTPAGFTAAARATPGLDRWLAEGVSEPTSPVHAITSPPNTLRGTATSYQRPVPGLFPVGDAACTTNPLFGRGMSLALAHAFALADVLRAHPVIGSAQSRAAARAAEDLFLPWYEQSAAADLARITRWRATVHGSPTPSAGAPSAGARAAQAPSPSPYPSPADVAAAARTDGRVWRGLTRMLMSLATPAQVLGDDAFLARVRQAQVPPATGPQAPSRTALVHLLADAEGVRR
ncbi:NAD(P)/FAD-dependent oxidoreductase [Streptomyces sp. NPDC059949]|uniref:NAD(P)/FAD-dependent oxidoreductase n=1 Tax=Streptomyces sp. NPDC059949 TaxID=3347013 RepID=UPI0036686309